MSDMIVRTRFAPSPTGYLHIGGVRTALFAWLYARRHAGSFILRIEDTDRERSTQQAVDIILDGLDWLDLNYDEGPVYQSQRTDRYRQVITDLLASGFAYPCYCSREELEAMRSAAMDRGEKPRYDGRCRDRAAPPDGAGAPVIRFRNPPDGEVIIEDQVQGTVVYRNSELDDLIIARSDNSPTYNLTVVVDDMDMEITHVIRGDDHLNNTPRQVNIFNALGLPAPVYAHVPMILGEDGKKLSKRAGTASILEYREAGYLPEAVLNYLVRLGWSHGDQEIFSIAEMIDLFDITDINRSAAALNPEKLLWLNQHYIRHSSNERLAPLLARHLIKTGIDTSCGPPLATLCEVQKERVKTLDEMARQSRYFYRDFEHFEESAAKKHLRPAILEPLQSVYASLAALDQWSAESIHRAIELVAGSFGLKLGKIAQPLRVAVTGTAVSPAIDVTLALIGRNRVLERLQKALEYVRNRADLDSKEGVT